MNPNYLDVYELISVAWNDLNYAKEGAIKLRDDCLAIKIKLIQRKLDELMNELNED